MARIASTTSSNSFDLAALTRLLQDYLLGKARDGGGVETADNVIELTKNIFAQRRCRALNEKYKNPALRVLLDQHGVEIYTAIDSAVQTGDCTSLKAILQDPQKRFLFLLLSDKKQRLALLQYRFWQDLLRQPKYTGAHKAILATPYSLWQYLSIAADNTPAPDPSMVALAVEQQRYMAVNYLKTIHSNLDRAYEITSAEISSPNGSTTKLNILQRELSLIYILYGNWLQQHTDRSKPAHACAKAVSTAKDGKQDAQRFIGEINFFKHSTAEVQPDNSTQAKAGAQLKVL